MLKMLKLGDVSGYCDNISFSLLLVLSLLVEIDIIWTDIYMWPRTVADGCFL